MRTEVLPIAGYDDLTATEILKVVKRLSPSERTVVAAHERATKARVTILRRLDRLADSVGGELVVDLRDDPAGTCLLCEAQVDSLASFVVHLREAHGLAEDPGFESTLPKRLLAPVAVAEPETKSVPDSPRLDRLAAMTTAPESDPKMAAIEREIDYLELGRPNAEPVLGPIAPDVERYESFVEGMDRFVPQSVSAWGKLTQSGWVSITCFWVILILVIAGGLLVIG